MLDYEQGHSFPFLQYPTAFCNSMIELLDVSENGVHIGMVIAEGAVHFQLDKFYNKYDASEFVRQSTIKDKKNKVIHEKSNMSGLRLLRERVFGGPGDRPDAPNLVIMLMCPKAKEQSPPLNATEANMLKQDADIIVIACGNAEKDLLLNIASSPSMFSYTYRSSEIESLLPRVLSLIRKQIKNSTMTHNVTSAIATIPDIVLSQSTDMTFESTTMTDNVLSGLHSLLHKDSNNSYLVPAHGKSFCIIILSFK